MARFHAANADDGAGTSDVQTAAPPICTAPPEIECSSLLALNNDVTTTNPRARLHIFGKLVSNYLIVIDDRVGNVPVLYLDVQEIGNGAGRSKRCRQPVQANDHRRHHAYVAAKPLSHHCRPRTREKRPARSQCDRARKGCRQELSAGCAFGTRTAHFEYLRNVTCIGCMSICPINALANLLQPVNGLYQYCFVKFEQTAPTIAEAILDLHD